MSKEVILVGNAPSILGKGMGSMIDSHQEVVRFNHARTKVAPADVGTKTTRHAMSISVAMTTQKPIAKPIVPTPLCPLKDHQWLYLESLISSNRLPLAFTCAAKHVADLPPRNVPSTGLMVAFWFYCHGHHVTFIGFGDGKGHYWDKSHRGNGRHDFEKEMELFLSWEKDGRAKVL